MLVPAASRLLLPTNEKEQEGNEEEQHTAGQRQADDDLFNVRKVRKRKGQKETFTGLS